MGIRTRVQESRAPKPEEATGTEKKYKKAEMKKLELLFIPAPGIGHLVPVFELAKRLIGHDDRISGTILASKSTFSSSVDSKTKSLAASNPQIKLVDVPKPHVKDIVTNINLSSPQANSSDSIQFQVGSLAFMLHLPKPSNQSTAEIKGSDPEILIHGIINPVRPSVLPLSVTDGSFSAYVKLAERFRGTKGIVVNTFVELETHAIESFLGGQSQSQTPPVNPVGPVIDLKGAWGALVQTQVKEISLGLEQSGQRFSWSLRLPPVPQGKTTRASNSSNSEDILPDGFLGRVLQRKGIYMWVRCRSWPTRQLVVLCLIVGGIQFWRACGMVCLQ
ncbi:unnamed protein product [Prunus armeniaca]